VQRCLLGFSFGSYCLNRECDLPLSYGVLKRIGHAHGLVHRRKRYRRQPSLAVFEATGWRLQPISADTQDLDDTPHYWPQAQASNLPSVPDTAREVRGALRSSPSPRVARLYLD
jgi:hypothetical protein